MKENCPLCNNTGNKFHIIKDKIYFQCEYCNGIFMSKKCLPNEQTEIERYKSHNNDVNDIGYQQFVSPITASILKDFTKNNIGLDFGAGTGPVISKILKDNNFQIYQYDPFFDNHKNLLMNKYDYIACCEVIEHFHNPNKEFKLLKYLLNKDSKLYCMTDIYYNNIDFSNWYYKNDDTHVFFYTEKTLNIIKEMFNFKDISIDVRLIIFST